MKKRLTLIALVLVCALALSACGCKHETWNTATCETPKTCADCGATEGEALGHAWADATCETPKTCSNCGKTEGEALGHAWVDADCENPKTCSNCALTEGEALGHAWVDATTEAPKTCETCGTTEGDPITTDPRFTTESTAALQGTWASELNMSSEMLGLDGFENGVDCILYLELHNDGSAVLRIEAADIEAFEADMTAYLAQALYDELAAAGLDKDAADAAFEETYGMSIEAYAALIMAEMDMEALFQEMRVDMVYFVEDGKLYMGESWTDDMGEPSPFQLDGDTLILEEDMSELGIDQEQMVFTRVTDGE